jgi:sigma-B regulation protein RsbU (phosphoserine phosphatase)
MPGAATVRTSDTEAPQAKPCGRLLAVTADMSPATDWTEPLAEAGHRIKLARSTSTALAVLEKFGTALDTVLLDNSIAESEALTFLSALRQAPAGAYIPVVKFAAEPTEAQVIEGLRAGIWYYLATPCNPALLLAAVESAVADHDRHRRLQAQAQQNAQLLRDLIEGTFRFRSLDDVERVARVVANACPGPDRVIIGLSELMLNAVEHGNLGIGYEEKSQMNARGTWLDEIRMRLDAPEQAGRYALLRFKRHAHEVTMRIEDCGEGFDWASYMEVSSARAFDTHGRGIAIARALSFDSVVYSGRGNVVTVAIKAER